MRLNKTIERLSAGKPVFGMVISSHTARSAQFLAQSTLDWVLVDMEHSPWDMEHLRSFLLGLTDKRRIAATGSLQSNVTPIVRLPQNGRDRVQFLIKQALDIGAFGVMVPHVETAEETLALVKAARPPQPRSSSLQEPKGERGLWPMWASWYWGLSPAEYVEKADLWPLNPEGEVLLLPMIESPVGVKNIDEILQVPGVGGIHIGASDLSYQMGCGGLPRGIDTSPPVEEAILKVLHACKRHDVPCGITAFEPADVEKRLEQGFRFIWTGMDDGAGVSPVYDSRGTLMQAQKWVAERGTKALGEQ
jgi:4-hydroxy-2-oxoheptanedioate aldolase